ncbi:MAG: 2-C-methyl-D-erythritol 4-phosphate cytidylyltransferase [Dehalococcoidia bacterium]|nr:MAG: 2-C-methyl-D-erythritol 4-phosphate cytidylyltransferase [Dehalococcoidia bacterium]
MFNNQKTGAIITAAGRGMRMGKVDKIFTPVGGKPLLLWVIEAFQNCTLIDQIIVVLGKENIKRGHELPTEGRLSKVSDICPGGDERQQSVANGLNLLDDCYWVVIHDGARPIITEVLIKEGLEAAEESGAAVAAVPVIDTIKLADDDGFVMGTPPRNSLWAVQTPQVFRFDIISQAHSKAKGLATDDAALVERLGYKIKLYKGSYANIKVTNPSDLAIVEILLKGYG